MSDPIREMRQYLSSSSTGCLFAARLARQWDEASWLSPVLSGSNLGEKIEDALADTQGYEVGLLIFPEIKTANAIADLILELKAPRWTRASVKWGANSAGPLPVLVGLTWVLNDPKYITMAMGFADIPEMPPMRRAPHTAIALRLGGPWAGRKSSKLLHGKELVTFGDVPSLLPDEPTQRPEFLQMTSINKEELLSGHVLQAVSRKLSKVAFALPFHCNERVFGRN